MLIECMWRWRALARHYGNTCQKFTCEWRVSQGETGSLKPDIDVEQKTDIYAFALNDILKFILRFAG